MAHGQMFELRKNDLNSKVTFMSKELYSHILSNIIGYIHWSTGSGFTVSLHICVDDFLQSRHAVIG